MTSPILRKNYTIEIIEPPKPCCCLFACWNRKSNKTVIHFDKNYEVDKTTEVYLKRKSSEVAREYYEKKKEANARDDLEEISLE